LNDATKTLFEHQTDNLDNHTKIINSV